MEVLIVTRDYTHVVVAKGVNATMVNHLMENYMHVKIKTVVTVVHIGNIRMGDSANVSDKRSNSMDVTVGTLIPNEMVTICSQVTFLVAILVNRYGEEEINVPDLPTERVVVMDAPFLVVSTNKDVGIVDIHDLVKRNVD